MKHLKSRGASAMASSVWPVCASARKIYNSQLEQTCETRSRSLDACLNRTYASYHTFGDDLQETSKILLDSVRFTAECDELGLKAEIVAPHIVFEGRRTFEDVRNKGAKAVLGKKLIEFDKPLYEEK